MFVGLEASVPAASPDYTYSVLDAFVPLSGDENAQCRCKRGAQVSFVQLFLEKTNQLRLYFKGHPGVSGARGPRGNPGERGPRGSKGERGSFDFLLLLLADLRHDIVHLQNKIFTNGEK